MKTWKKIVLALGIVCLLTGLLVCVVAVARLDGRSDNPLDTLLSQISVLPHNADGQQTGDGSVSHIYIPECDFSRLHMDLVDARIILLPAKDGRPRVEYTENPDHPISLSLEEGTLQILQESTWYFSFLPLPRSQIRVYLENRQYDAAILETTSGDIELSAGLAFGTVRAKSTSGSITCHAQVMGALELGSTSGKLSVSDVTCGEASLETTSGRLEMTNLLCRGELEAETTSGALRLQACDARNLSLESVSGSIRGSLRTDKQFRTETVSGAVHVPLSSGTGLCEIETTSGSIHITVEAAS